MLHDLFAWIQNTWGADHTVYGRSYSAALHESLNFWGLLEGTHMLTLMLFFGTILMVDMRLLGVSFRKTPVSVVSDRILPLTVISMVILLVTGVVLFFAKPEEYFHNLWFRVKMVLLVVAIVNVYIFHKLIQKNQVEWDSAESPPRKAKISAIISLTSWILVIACGRFIAYNWFECGKPQWAWVNAAQECKASSLGAMSIAEGKAIEVQTKAAAEAQAAAPAAPAAALPALPELPALPQAAQPEAK